MSLSPLWWDESDCRPPSSSLHQLNRRLKLHLEGGKSVELRRSRAGEERCSGIIMKREEERRRFESKVRKCAVTAASFQAYRGRRRRGQSQADSDAPSFIIFSGCHDGGLSDGALNHRHSPPESGSDGWERRCLWPTCCRPLFPLLSMRHGSLGRRRRRHRCQLSELRQPFVPSLNGRSKLLSKSEPPPLRPKRLQLERCGLAAIAI